MALLGGTAAAFAVTQGLKLEKSPILAPRISKVFSPVCDCATRVAAIGFTLRKPDRVRLQIVQGDDVVRTLVEGKRLRRGALRYSWNGRDDLGRFVPEGVYKPRIHLQGQRRTIDLPNEMRVDTAAPQIALARVSPGTFSPDGDDRADRVVVSYRVSEPAHGILLVNGRRRVRTRGQPKRGELAWYGRAGGRALPAGTYRLRLVAEDRAGNVSRPGPLVAVRIRYVELARDVIRATASTRFGVGVSSDARRIRWRLGRRGGSAEPGLLVLRAPGKPGRLALVVEANGHRDRAVVIVRPRK